MDRPDCMSGGALPPLENSQLLALALDGRQGPAALARARRDLRACSSLRTLLGPEPPPGISALRWARLRAVAELMRRAELETLTQTDALLSPEAVRRFLRLWLHDRPVECFAGVFLDSQHRVIAARELFTGTLAQTAVYPREVVRQALRLNAAAVILAHNHPSGVAEPSAADRLLTEALRAALAQIDIPVLDHLIVAGNRCVSFAERGWL
ncbi:MAG: DNA repair protein RadC [Betaproteobacteria bacterium]|nr:DNA repair protein RadC [Betaproteobacteria bacterium]